MENAKSSTAPQEEPDEEPSGQVYEIRVAGCMDKPFWTDRFGGMGLSVNPERGETLLRGPIVDQAALYGLLSQLRNQGLTLISVLRVSPGKDR
jgi:hypothetical protein